MAYHVQEFESRPKGRKSYGVRIALFLLMVGIGVGAFAYREKIWRRATQAFAPAKEDPIPVMALEKAAFQLEVPAFGEITGLDSVPVPTPATRAGGLRVAWLIPEGSFVKAG